MKIQNLISKKIQKKELNWEEIQFLVDGYSSDQISEKEMHNMLNAFAKSGMTEKETIMLFDYNYQNIKKISLKNIKGFKIDKHSSGGVGDKISLILLPILAALNFKVIKFSGERLGFTGGTTEKLKSFENINLQLSNKKIEAQCQKTELIISNVENINIFEKKLYKLRSKTNNMEIMGLIVNSILIKKMLFKTDCLILDLKIGHGAFFKNLKTGKEFIRLASKILQKHNYKTIFFLTNMNQPLGKAIGNKIEIIEALKIISGKCKPKPDIWEIITNMIQQIYFVQGKKYSLKKTEEKIEEIIKNGLALKKFKVFIEINGGNFNKLFEKQILYTKYKFIIKSWKKGYINFINTAQIGYLANKLNLKNNHTIDYQGGIEILKKNNTLVEKGEAIAIIYTNNDNLNNLKLLEKEYKKGVKIKKNKDESQKNGQSSIIKILKNF